MQKFYMGLTIVSLLLLVLGMVFNKTRRSLITEPIAAMGAGIVVGPYVLNLVNMADWGGFDRALEAAGAITISMALMSSAYKLPKNYLSYALGLQSKLLLLGMPGMWLMSALIIKLCVPFGWPLSLLTAAIITPTDPVVAATIASGRLAEKLLPANIRHAITFESSANDGLAFPLVMLPLLFILDAQNPLKEWFLFSVLWQTVAAVVIGAAIGYIASKIFQTALSKKSMSKPSMLVFSSALGFFVLAFLQLINCNGIIGVFSAGFVAHHLFNEDISREQSIEQEARERLFIIPIFFIFGVILPWQDWFQMGWIILIVPVAILLFRRLPVILALRPLIKKTFSLHDVMFIGWFGPIGAAAMFYAVYTYRILHNGNVWTLVSAIIFASTILHGITGYAFSRKYHERFMQHDKQPEAVTEDA